MVNISGRLALFMTLVVASYGFVACGSSSSSRTQRHEGVDMKLLSIARMPEYQAGMERVRAKSPDQEVAVVQVQFSPAGGSNLKLPADQTELKDTDGKTYHSDADLEFSLGSSDNVMVWDLTFAVPKTAALESLRLGSANFHLGGVRELDPTARIMPGSHPRK
jgi:hypothetical protein